MKLTDTRPEFDEIVSRFLTGGASGVSGAPWPSGGYNVPTDVFHTEGALVIRMELPGVRPDDVEVTVQENNLVINGTRKFPYDAESVQFVRRGTFYGDFTQRVALGKGLDVEGIKAGYEHGVLVLTVPYAAEAQPRRIAVEVGEGQPSLGATP
jgi:HSP20 family protein